MSNWYVYSHIRLDLNIPFYIGIGYKKNFGRAFEKNPSKRTKAWLDIVSLTAYQVDIVYTDLDQETAERIEKELIGYYGRADLNKGSLCNATDGGVGGGNRIISDITREKIGASKRGSLNPHFGKKQSKEHLDKRMAAIRGQKRSKETCNLKSLRAFELGWSKVTQIYNYTTGVFLGEFRSMSEACRSVGLDPTRSSSKASQVARGIRNHHKNYVFKYLEN